MSSKDLDFLVRSIVTAVIALSLIGAIVVCSLTKIPLNNDSGTILISSASVVLGYYFGNHAAINGGMLATSKVQQSADNIAAAVHASVCDEAPVAVTPAKKSGK